MGGGDEGEKGKRERIGEWRGRGKMTERGRERREERGRRKKGGGGEGGGYMDGGWRGWM